MFATTRLSKKTKVSRATYDDGVYSNPYYCELKHQIDNAKASRLSLIGESVVSFLLDFFKEFLEAKVRSESFDETYYEEALVLLGDAHMPKSIILAFSTIMEYVFDYCQYEVAMMAQILDKVVEILVRNNYEISYVDDDDNDNSSTYKRHSNFLDIEIYGEQDDNDEVNTLNNCYIVARNHIELAEERALERKQHIQEAHRYICSQRGFVTKEQLSAQSKKYTRTILQEVAAMPDILDYQDRYIAYDNLRISKKQVADFSRRLKEFLLREGKVCHIEQIYTSLGPSNQTFFSSGSVENSKQLYSLLSALLGTSFSFSDPFVALKGVTIESPDAKFKTFLQSCEEIKIESMLSYAKEQYVNINSTLDFLVSLDNQMLIKNRINMININYVDMSEESVAEIEEHICEELESKNQDFCAIRELKCKTVFPCCNIAYDEWFIYSIIHRWGTRLKLQSTPGQFRLSIPVVSIRANVSKSDLQRIAEQYRGQTDTILEHTLDNLDDFDSLIGSEIGLDDILI